MVDILIVDMMDVLPQIGVRTIICGKLRMRDAGSSYRWCGDVLSLSVSLSLSLSQNTNLYITQPMWTPLQPVGRCRLAGNDSGDENSIMWGGGSINSIIDCIDACIADGDDCVAIEYDGGGYCELWRSLPVMTENTGEDDENCLLKGDQLGMENAVRNVGLRVDLNRENAVISVVKEVVVVDLDFQETDVMRTMVWTLWIYIFAYVL